MSDESYKPTVVFMTRKDLDKLLECAIGIGTGLYQAGDLLKMLNTVDAMGGIPERTVWLQCRTGIDDGDQVIMEANLKLLRKDKGRL